MRILSNKETWAGTTSSKKTKRVVFYRAIAPFFVKLIYELKKLIGCFLFLSMIQSVIPSNECKEIYLLCDLRLLLNKKAFLSSWQIRPGRSNSPAYFVLHQRFFSHTEGKCDNSAAVCRFSASTF